MNRFSRCFTFSLSTLVLVSCFAPICFAHFPWLVLDKQDHALLFFSESPAERDYHLPESVAEAKVVALAAHEKPKTVELKTLEEGDVIGRRSVKPITPKSTLDTAISYGNYHGTLLQYYALHLPPVGTKSAKFPEGSRPRLAAQVAPSKAGIEVTVLWEGKPIKDAGVTIIDADDERADQKTDADGKTTFSTQAHGLTSFIISHVVKSKGESGGKPYTSESHYCTVTTEYQGAEKQAPAAEKTARYAPLPEALASFGAAVSDGWLYVYSGHTGKAHDHSRDNLSQSFYRLPLSGQGAWENLPMQTALQGFPLVTHGGKLYRVGGLVAKNAAGEDEDLHSVAEFASYDPQRKTWTALPNLPAGRSSHDAVVIGDKLYVAGGWQLDGEGEGEWLDESLVLDLGQENPSWQPLPTQPFRRRALAAAEWKGKLIVLGGMDEGHDISRSVDVFDPATGQWAKLADFPGEGMSGFGISAWNVGGKLYASASEGIVYRLDDQGQKWTEIATLNRPRFFHRLLAANETELLVIGGASLDEEGHLRDIETVELQAD